ncbi:MAG: sigma factor-like helix-turn-helix DNA-binding protein [Pseudomonadales bacterium]
MSHFFWDSRWKAFCQYRKLKEYVSDAVDGSVSFSGYCYPYRKLALFHHRARLNKGMSNNKQLGNEGSPFDIRIVDLAKVDGIDNRLKNILLRANASGKLPFETVGEFLNSGHREDAMLAIPGFGWGAYKTFQRLVEDVSVGKVRPLVEGRHQAVTAATAQTTFLELVQSPFVSARTANGVTRAWKTGEFPFRTVSDYLDSGRDRSKLNMVPNLGRKSVDELDALVDSCLGVKKSDEPYLEHGTVFESLQQYLDERSYKVLMLRLGGKTLQEIGVQVGVTRERVRQVQAKAEKKIRKIFAVQLQDFAIKLDRLLSSANGEVTVLEAAARTGFTRNETELLVSAAIENLPKPAKYSVGVLRYVEIERKKVDWDSSIDESLATQAWPVSFQQIVRDNSDIPVSYIQRFLTERRGASIHRGTITQLSKISSTLKATFVLRHAKGAITPAKGVEIYRELFGEHIEEHNLQSIFGRMDNALIVKRGLYALYEHLNLEEDELSIIRETGFTILQNLKRFTSAKVLFEVLVDKLDPSISIKVTGSYLLYGILQDDDRFLTRRGLMLGIKAHALGNAFVPLGDEIIDIVRERGPISVGEIKRVLATHRKVLDVTISMFLKNSKEVVRVNPGSYDIAERAVGGKTSLEAILLAINIVLSDSPSTLFDLCSKLSVLDALEDVPINHSIISSILSTMEEVTFEQPTYSIVEVDGRVKKYIAATKNNREARAGALKPRLIASGLSAADAQLLMDLDFRRAADFQIQRRPTDDFETGTELSQILSSFT